MSTMPECQRCGNFVHSGQVICYECLQTVLDEVDNHLVATTGSGWTYARDVVSVIRDAFGAGKKVMPTALLPEERETGELRYPIAPNDNAHSSRVSAAKEG